MDYSIEILVAERDKLYNELLEAKTGEEKDWNWSVVIRHERAIADIDKALNLLVN